VTPIFAGIISADVPDDDFISADRGIHRNFPCNIGDDDRSAVQHLQTLIPRIDEVPSDP